MMMSNPQQPLENIPIETIPSEHFILKRVNVAEIKNRWSSKRRPSEVDFMHRIIDGEREDGISTQWEKYCSLTELFIRVGVQKNRKDEYMNPKHFKAIKLNVGDIRALEVLIDVDVIHSPLSPDDYGHSLICFEEDGSDEVRLKLCDLVENHPGNLYYPEDFTEIIKIVEEKRASK